MEFYNIYNIKKYNQESRKKESYTIEELLEKLKSKENYHEIIKKDERIKFIMDIDKLKGCKIEEIIKDLIEFLNKRGIEVKESEISLTKNVNPLLESFHLTIPKINVLCEKLRYLICDFKNENEKYSDFIDTSIYASMKLFRLPNQLKKNVRNTEHKIIKGKMEDFILNYAEKSEMNIDEYIKEVKKLSKSKVLRTSKHYEVKSNRVYIINNIKTIKMLNDLDKKYLKDYDLWFKITSVLKYHNLKEIWTIWSKSSEKYNEEKNEVEWNNARLEIDMNWIRWILNSEGHEYEYIKNYEKINEEYDNKNKVVIEKKKLEYNVNKLKEYEVIVLKSDAGTGKTSYTSTIVKGMKKENKNVKVMSLITNKSLINQHKKTFKEWGDIELLDYIDDEHLIGNDFIICVNSLLKIKDITNEELKDYVIFIDEIDSFMYNLSHNGTLNPILREMVGLLIRIINNCKKMVCCSVHIKKNLEMILNKEKKVIMIENKYKNFKDVEAYEKSDMNEMVEEMLKTIERNEYFMFVCDEKRMAKKMYLKCLEKIGDKSRMVLKTADDKYEIKDASIDLKDKWIFFSPSVIFGVDISLTVSQNVFLFSSGRSINSYQLFQQVCRTRNIKKVYYHFDKLTRKLKYSSLKETNEYYERNIKNYERIHNLCVNMDEELNEVVVKNKFFDIFCFNEYLNNIYGLDKKKKFEEIMCDSGFKIKSDEKLNKKLDKNENERLKNKIIVDENEKVEEYIKKWNDRDTKKFEEIDKRVKLLGIENVKEKEMYKYKDVIKDESGITKHLNTIKLLKSDEYLKSEMEERMKNTMKVKMLNDINSKILLIRKIEEDNKIDFLDVEFKEEGVVVLSDKDYNFIKKVFRSERKKPKNRNELKKLYVSMIKHLNGELVVSDRNKTKKDRDYRNHYLNKEKIKYYLELDKYNNPKKKYFHIKVKNKFLIK